MKSGKLSLYIVWSFTYDGRSGDYVRGHMGSRQQETVPQHSAAEAGHETLARREFAAHFPAVFSHALILTFSGNFTRGGSKEKFWKM